MCANLTYTPYWSPFCHYNRQIPSLAKKLCKHKPKHAKRYTFLFFEVIHLSFFFVPILSQNLFFFLLLIPSAALDCVRTLVYPSISNDFCSGEPSFLLRSSSSNLVPFLFLDQFCSFWNDRNKRQQHCQRWNAKLIWNTSSSPCTKSFLTPYLFVRICCKWYKKFPRTQVIQIVCIGGAAISGFWVIVDFVFWAGLLCGAYWITNVLVDGANSHNFEFSTYFPVNGIKMFFATWGTFWCVLCENWSSLTG